jgi:hypothetical protein
MSQYFASAFRRRPNEGWFRAGNFAVTTVDLICGLAVFTMFVYGILGRSTWNHLVFTPWLVRDLEVWRLATWTTATQPDFWPLLGVVFFWMLGQDVEAMLGRTRFLGWFASVTVVPALIMTFLGALNDTLDRTTVASGLQPVFLAAIWVYAATYPKVKWFDVVPLWAVAAVFTLLNVLRYNGDGLRGMVVLTALVILVSLTTARSLGAATGWEIPHIPLPSGGGGKRRPSGPVRSSKGKVRGKGRSGHPVVEGPWTAPTPTPVANTKETAAAQAELDDLLDKISASGLDSLTADEKRRLNELSKRLR